MIVDFHSHTTASDGALSPQQLIARALQFGVELLAITDHDNIDGYLAVRDEAASLSGFKLIAGVELSCVWGNTSVHIVGLNIDADCPQLRANLAAQQRAREQRAQMIGARLEKLGCSDAYAGAARLAKGNPIGRPHFAQFLVESGRASSLKQAFKRYLGPGKSGDIKTLWPSLATVIEWINRSGGVAVLAHPLHYNMTATKLRALLVDFKAAGGAGLEVVSGQQNAAQTQQLAQLSVQYELAASVGSDFHHPDTLWAELGRVGTLPPQCWPVWSGWETQTSSAGD